MLCDLWSEGCGQVPERGRDPDERVLQDQFTRHEMFLQQGVDYEIIQLG